MESTEEDFLLELFIFIWNTRYYIPIHAVSEFSILKQSAVQGCHNFPPSFAKINIAEFRNFQIKTPRVQNRERIIEQFKDNNRPHSIY